MVVHGPDIFDEGYVGQLMGLIRPDRVIVSGVMARTAAEESGLDLEFPGAPPSLILRELRIPAFLANCGKTEQSGYIFGDIVAGRVLPAGLLHLECRERRIFAWNHPDTAFCQEIAGRTGYSVRNVCSSSRVSTPVYREIQGCLPGEPVFVNGLVIGTATGKTVVIRTLDGVVEPVSGIVIKPHGVEKLARRGPVSLDTAWCKSGMIRSGRPEIPASPRSRTRCGRVLVVDHCGHELFKNLDPGVAGVLAIGDDTTSVCGHICAERGIPVLGIVDGDADGVVAPRFAPGSVIVRVHGGTDDEVGREISSYIPQSAVEWEPWVQCQVSRIGSRGCILYPGSREP